MFVSENLLQLQIDRVIVDDKRHMCANPEINKKKFKIFVPIRFFSFLFCRNCLTLSKFERRNRRSSRVPFGKMNNNRIASASDGSGSEGTSKARSIFCRAISCQIARE